MNMATHIPHQTPIKNSRSSNKKLPMIVDIAIDNNGKQLYQVHESSKLVRKEMPKSTNFNNNNYDSLTNTQNIAASAASASASNPLSNSVAAPTGVNNTLLDNDEERTPIRRILGTISPSTLNQKKSNLSSDSDQEDFVDQQDSNRSKNLYENEYNQYTFMGVNVNSNLIAGPSNSFDTSATNSSNNNLSQQDTDIWSEDVENAFEEVLSIIPKNGLNKIKISGRSCGRNELISDYILTKTGKFRSRKQVSSHIQVIKNLGQKLDIIKLINDGPIFNSKEEQEMSTKKFEEIFSKINLNKSLGLNDSINNISNNSTGLKRRLNPSSNIKRFKFNKVNIKLENFFISIQDSNNANPIIITLQKNEEPNFLKLKENAIISNRFPGLNDFQNTSIPIIHNMVNLNLPNQLPLNYSIDNGLKTNLYINLNEYINSNESISIFTGIYSFGNEVLKINDDDFKLNENKPFLIKFWKFFFNQLLSKPNSMNTALKSVTIKQIIYENTKDFNNNTNNKTYAVSKLKIKAVLLWEFAKVEDIKHAITTTTKLVLPDKISNEPTNFQPYNQANSFEQQNSLLESSLLSENAILPQSVTYQPTSNNLVPTGNFSASTANSMVTPSNNLNSASTLATSNTIATPILENAIISSSNAVPQVNVQRKFQSLQQQQHHHQPGEFEFEQDPNYPQPVTTTSAPLVVPSAPTNAGQQPAAPPYQPVPIMPPTQQQFPYQTQQFPQVPLPPNHQPMNMDLMMIQPNDQSQDYQFGGLLYPEPPSFIGDQF